MPREVLRVSSISMAVAWIAVACMGGVASILALMLCWLCLGRGGADSADKHGISESLSGRVGGVVVVGYSLASVAFFHIASNTAPEAITITVFVCFFCFFCLGFFEDFKGSVSAGRRFALMLVLASLVVVSEPLLRLHHVNIFYLDELLSSSSIISSAFTILCLTFLPNAFNTADGANGLVGGTSLLTLATLALALSSELSVLQMSTAVGCAVFLVFNIQTGRFFLGDGGAYGLGVLVGCSMIYLNTIHADVTWFLVSLVFYPTADLIWSMLRRVYTGVAVYEADDFHLHNLLHLASRRVTDNAKLANNATGGVIVTMFCLIPTLFLWSGLMGVDDHRWVYILCGQSILYLLFWFGLKNINRSRNLDSSCETIVAQER